MATPIVVRSRKVLRSRLRSLEISRRAPRQARARASYDAILDATARILLDESLGGLTTNKVAETAGVGIATLYAYFADKEALLIALARRILEEDRKSVLTALETNPSDKGLARRMIDAVVANHMRDCYLRRIALSALIGAGGASEIAHHAEVVVQVIANRAEKLGNRAEAMDAAQMFVITRAVLGVARAITNEPENLPELSRVREELVRLVELFV